MIAIPNCLIGWYLITYLEPQRTRNKWWLPQTTMCYVGILHYHRETAIYSWLKLRFQVQKCYSCELIMYHVSSRLSLIQRFVGLSPVSLWYFILWLWVKAPPGWYPIAGIYRKWRNRGPILPRFRKCSVSCISYSIIYFIDLEYVPLYHVYTHYKYTHTNIYINIYIYALQTS